MTRPDNTLPAIEFDAVRFAYNDAAPALDGATLTVGKGEFVCIVGANGSGKSTLARCINALIAPDEGTVHIFGRDTSDPDCTLAIRSDVGMVFQNPDDQLVCTLVEDDVAFGPGNLGIAPGELRQRVDESLALVGLDGMQRRETSKLSGGQKQLVALAGALAMRPRILVLDEATAMLDPAGRKTILAICENLHAQGTTIVMVTHFMEQAARADRVIVLDAGRVALDGAPADVLTRADELDRLGLDVPPACKLAFELRKRGIDVRPALSAAELEEQLCRLRSIA